MTPKKPKEEPEKAPCDHDSIDDLGFCEGCGSDRRTPETRFLGSVADLAEHVVARAKKLSAVPASGPDEVEAGAKALREAGEVLEKLARAVREVTVVEEANEKRRDEWGR